ncbi:hypothetical protein AA313_de0208252 [Arthrobotrys entomopaga]|nr:hypothetical protein AA313_de0208252 [Arthrobotrys entomopaga]
MQKKRPPHIQFCSSSHSRTSTLLPSASLPSLIRARNCLLKKSICAKSSSSSSIDFFFDKVTPLTVAPRTLCPAALAAAAAALVGEVGRLLPTDVTELAILLTLL